MARSALRRPPKARHSLRVAGAARGSRPVMLTVLALLGFAAATIWQPIVILVAVVWGLAACAAILDAGLRGRYGLVAGVLALAGGPLAVTLIALATHRHVRKVQPRFLRLRVIAVAMMAAGAAIGYAAPTIALPRVAFTVPAPGHAFQPRIEPGDRLLISPLALGRIGRGEIIAIAPFPGTAALHLHGRVVGLGRVIGLGGEWIGATDHGLYICVSAPNITQPVTNATPGCMVPDETGYITARTPPFGPVHIGRHRYFVLADNRADLADSRSFGAIPRSAIAGRIIAILWPPARLGVR